MAAKVKKTILITDRITESAELFLKQFPFLEIRRTHSPVLNAEDLLGIHGLLIRSRTKISEDLLAKASNLQVIVTCTSGFDHIDLVSAKKWGVTVMCTPEANVQAAAELTWMHVMMLARKFPQTQVLIQSEIWKKEHVTGSELCGKTFGIIGLGRIGRKVKEFAQAFQMKVLAHDPFLDEKIFKAENVEPSPLDQLFELCDFISVHVPQTSRTHHMINDHLLKKGRGVLKLINTSRGNVIDENHLRNALVNKNIQSCALDVFSAEPVDAGSPLLQSLEVIATPHIGANTEEALEKASVQGSEQICAFFQDGTTSNTLPPKAAWYFEE